MKGKIIYRDQNCYFLAECKQVYFSCKTGDFKMGDYGEAPEGSLEWLLEELQFLAWFR